MHIDTHLLTLHRTFFAELLLYLRLLIQAFDFLLLQLQDIRDRKPCIKVKLRLVEASSKTTRTFKITFRVPYCLAPQQLARTTTGQALLLLQLVGRCMRVADCQLSCANKNFDFSFEIHVVCR
jgi:hypothetical protein